MSQATDQNPMSAVTGPPDYEMMDQQRLIELATQQRRRALGWMNETLNDSKIITVLREFQRARLGNYSRIMKYFGTTHLYDPRHPSAGDFTMQIELQWSDDPIDFGAEDTPAGSYLIPLFVLSGDGIEESIAFPDIYQRVTRPEWQADTQTLGRLLEVAYAHAVKRDKRARHSYRYPSGIQAIYDIEMVE